MVLAPTSGTMACKWQVYCSFNVACCPARQTCLERHVPLMCLLTCSLAQASANCHYLCCTVCGPVSTPRACYTLTGCTPPGSLTMLFLSLTTVPGCTVETGAMGTCTAAVQPSGSSQAASL